MCVSPPRDVHQAATSAALIDQGPFRRLLGAHVRVLADGHAGGAPAPICRIEILAEAIVDDEPTDTKLLRQDARRLKATPIGR